MKLSGLVQIIVAAFIMLMKNTAEAQSPPCMGEQYTLEVDLNGVDQKALRKCTASVYIIHDATHITVTCPQILRLSFFLQPVFDFTLLIPVGVEADHVVLWGDKDHRELFNFFVETQLVETGTPVDCTFDVVGIHRWDGQSVKLVPQKKNRSLRGELMPIPDESETDPALAGSE
eukprot:CAMPEP_0198286058 /NCGR_PEP_ID=MMETSP1449-20131203/5221_1 /TAXON_ID=420275 /ORGANISM="Attheya septentrionalis, Strain CCMP2084" /LENGTH=173 /DNA_ID=CAMNT_0043983677 /DNA_START=76 /DNA_END=597 /DNA_ORIENTATION=-